MRSERSLIEQALAARKRAGGLLLGLDFDGTLAPIAPRPVLARLPAHTRRLLAALARRPDSSVAIISGRELSDLKRKIALEGLHYAGNHGLEIDSPLRRWSHPGAVEAAAAIQALKAQLASGLSDLPGVWVEDKRFTLSVHYRLAPERHRLSLRARLASAARRAAGRLRVSVGHMVWEVRPRLRWNKGDALLSIAERLPGRPALMMIGDDRSDEEAFRRLGRRALSVRVGDARSSARFRVAGPEGVLALLESLANMN